jgi:hypothetical protein
VFRSIILRRALLLAFVAGFGWEGLGMTGSSNPKVVIAGIVLICLAGWGTWWLILSSLSDDGVEIVQDHPQHLLIGGCVTIAILCMVYGWWIYDDVAQPLQASSITNNYYGAPLTPRPEIKLGEPTQLNEKTAEGSQTIVDLTIVSPYPGNLHFTAEDETLLKADLMKCSPSGFCSFDARHVEKRKGYISLTVPSASGTFTLILVTSAPLRSIQDIIHCEVE